MVNVVYLGSPWLLAVSFKQIPEILMDLASMDA